MKTIIYIVGKANDENSKAWEFVGVFMDEKKALKSCITEDHFVGPAVLGKNYEDGKEWKGAWYPKLQDKPKTKKKIK